MSSTLSFRLPNRLDEELSKVSLETERSKSYHMQKALESYLEDQADLEVALERLRDTSDEVISLETIRENLGL